MKKQVRPQFHFTPPSGWMNDPNGLVCFQGIYHLFYQHFPDLPVWGPMHWGHAASSDLVHWEHRPIALFPDAEHGAAFSGSGVVDWENTSGLGADGRPPLVVLFTHSGGRSACQKQSLAYSTDGGESFEMWADNPVIDNPGIDDFRDPRVSRHTESGRWVMVLAAGDRVKLYGSPDLLNWEYLSDFGPGMGGCEGEWECPDLFRLPVEGEEGPGQWVLKVDDTGRRMGSTGAQYFIGDFNGRCFVNHNPPDTILRLDHGADFYAGQSWSDIPAEDGRRLFIAWMSNWDYALKTPAGKWRGALSLPRELALRRQADDSLRLVQRPAAEVESLRGGPLLRAWALEVTEGMSDLPFAGNQFELRLRLEPGDSARCGIEVLAAGDVKTVVGYQAATGSLFVDRSASGETDFDSGFTPCHEAPVILHNGGVDLAIFVDRSSVEVFAAGGLVTFCERVFPPPDATRVRFFSSGGLAAAKEVSAYALESIW